MQACLAEVDASPLIDKRLSDSADLVANLARAGTYPHAVQDIEVIETHISWVLLTGAYAYKIKKPVNLGFLDFSTLERRRTFCAEELRLNRRFAKDIYVDVVDIGGSLDAPVMDAKEGPMLDVAVRMHQFPADALLSRQLVAGRLSVDDMAEFGAMLARLHEDAPVAEPGREYGSPAAISAPIEDNFRVLQSTCGEMSPQLATIRDWTQAESHRLEPLFEQRRRAGRVRECHGDLHLANLIRWRGRILPFDCLEFDPGLRWIDVMNEVAFLFMDTLQHGRPDLAFSFLNRYLAASGDYAGLQLLRFYLVYRALVRAKVRALSHDSGADGDLREYLALAEHWITPSKKPALVITHGLSGSGKTALSGKLMTALPAVRLRSDLERKRLHGLSEHERSRSGIGTGLYSAATSEQTYARLAELARTGLAAGFNVIVDAAFLDPGQRGPFRELAEETGSDFIVLACDAPAEILRERIKKRARSGADASEADLAVLASQLAGSRPFTAAEDARAIHVDTRKELSGEELADMVLQEVEA